MTGVTWTAWFLARVLLSRAVLAVAGAAALIHAVYTWASPIPTMRQQLDVCALMDARPGWWRAVRSSEARWGAPAHVQLAIIQRESAFRRFARPPRRQRFGLPVGQRLSSAYGYPQALDGTWDHYKRAAGRPWAMRARFSDTTDFVAWYLTRTETVADVPLDDAETHYLAYHEGPRAFLRESHLAKPWLLDVAAGVGKRAGAYERQIDTCGARLDRDSRWWVWPAKRVLAAARAVANAAQRALA